MSRHYLDHASTSTLRPASREALVNELDEATADPGRIHGEGMRARYALERAREQVAAFLGARSREVVFTSGASESINAAIDGVTHAASTDKRHVVSTAVEHSAVTKSIARLTEHGTHTSTIVGVDHHGRVDADHVIAAIQPDTALVCLQLANHEVGAIQPVADVVFACRDRSVLCLVDAAQAIGHMPFSFATLGADLVALSAHKFGGPPGIGALLVRRGLRIEPWLVGGDQERARRAGLENLPAAAGFAAACAELNGLGALESEIQRMGRLTERVRLLAAEIEGVTLFGPERIDHRLPHLVCMGIDGIEPQGVLLGLDQRGIACHSGSSCSSESLEPSPVLEAMGVDAHRSLRVSIGWNTTDADIDALASALPQVVTHLRSLANPQN